MPGMFSHLTLVLLNTRVLLFWQESKGLLFYTCTNLLVSVKFLNEKAQCAVVKRKYGREAVCKKHSRCFYLSSLLFIAENMSMDWKLFYMLLLFFYKQSLDSGSR